MSVQPADQGHATPAVQDRVRLVTSAGATLLGEVTEVAGDALHVSVDDPAAALALAPGRIVSVWTEARPAPLGERPARVVWSRQAGARSLAALDLGAATADLGEAPLDVDDVRIDPEWARRLPATLALRRAVLPLGELDGQVHVACADPTDTQAIRAVQRCFDLPVRAVPAAPEALRAALDRVFAGGEPASEPAVGDGADPAGGAAVALCDGLLLAALLRRASDVHIDPEEDAARVRFRVDGQLELHRRLTRAEHTTLVSRIKVIAGLDIAEKRAAQDGSFKHSPGGRAERFDVRVATIPTSHGERVTLRLLGRSRSLTLEKLGMRAEHLKAFERAIHRPHGLILLTGPTGSGKTTTLYAGLRHLLERRDLNVLTIEDPIEYDIPGVQQVEVDAADKVTFAKALRSVLRHDPDVVMIGEVRDGETAQIGLRAALTGHLVLSTLHTNSATGAVTRLVDMGVERYLIAATLQLSVAQRLVRKLCRRCRAPVVLTAPEAEALRRPEEAGRVVFRPAGCLYCGGRGIVGRLGLFELLAMDAAWAQLVTRTSEEGDLLAAMRARRVPALVDDGVEKLLEGDCAFEDVMAAVSVW